MAPTSTTTPSVHDPRAVQIVAKSIYRELVDGGFGEQDVMALAGELLALVASGVRARRDDEQPRPDSI
jgi:hypothetical protein